jgi:SAM-dependent methyltransferase
VDPFREAVWQAVPDGVRPERANARLSFLLAHLGGGERLLDLGCGDGTFAAEAVRAGARVVAADVARGAVERARAAHPELDARVVPEDGPLPFAEDDFDVVWLGETIEHVVDTTLLLAEVRRVLRFGGTLLVTTPNHAALRTAALALRPRAFDAHFEPRADHLRFYTARTLRSVLHDAGFPDVDVRPVDGPPLLRRALHAVAR